MLNDEKLTEIVVTTEDGEFIAVIPKDGDIIQRHDVVLRFNYGEPKRYEDVGGKVYVVE